MLNYFDRNWVAREVNKYFTEKKSSQPHVSLSVRPGAGGSLLRSVVPALLKPRHRIITALHRLLGWRNSACPTIDLELQKESREMVDDFKVNSEAFMAWLKENGCDINTSIELADLRAFGKGRGVGELFF